MKIYIQTRKHIWAIGGREIIKKVQQPDWRRIESEFNLIFKHAEAQPKNALEGKAEAEFKFRSTGQWKRLEDMSLPEDNYGDRALTEEETEVLNKAREKWLDETAFNAKTRNPTKDL
jgi:hypothetical protein